MCGILNSQDRVERACFMLTVERGKSGQWWRYTPSCVFQLHSSRLRKDNELYELGATAHTIEEWDLPMYY